MSDRALITIAIGGDYLSNWRKYCAANWSSYAARHGLDVVVITELFHDSARSPAWQKCLVPASEQARKYRHIALLDADIVINPEAPNILEQTPEHLVGGILCGSHIHPDLQHVLLSRKFRQP